MEGQNRHSYSQLEQDLSVNTYTNHKRYGYFVEVGAHNGIELSNTYLLEKKYGWTGICIEPQPNLFSQLVANRPKSHCVNSAIYDTDGLIKDFVIADMLSGIVEHIDRHTYVLSNPKIKVPTVTLDTVLRRYHAPQFIDYLSVDAQGSELKVLKSIDFDAYRFGIIHVEHNFVEPKRTQIRTFLESKGYLYKRENHWDDEYLYPQKASAVPTSATTTTATSAPIQQQLSSTSSQVVTLPPAKRGIFYNSAKAVCSIWESGMMCYKILKQSGLYSLDYTEQREFDYSYDFAIVNHHYWVNNWVTPEMITKFRKPVFSIVTEVTPGPDPIALSPRIFTAFIVLDPSISDHDNIYGFCRPLEDLPVTQKLNIPDYRTSDIPIIGSFGFATEGKKWDDIIRQVHKEFDQALIRFNIPQATYVPNDVFENVIRNIHTESSKIITKPGIKVEITHTNYNKDELIEWCSKNTINVFFYYRNTSGLSAVADQAITANRPLLVSSDPTFRHIHRYLDYYPNIGIKQAITSTVDGVARMKTDWSATAFNTKFEQLLNTYRN